MNAPPQCHAETEQPASTPMAATLASARKDLKDETACSTLTIACPTPVLMGGHAWIVWGTTAVSAWQGSMARTAKRMSMNALLTPVRTGLPAKTM